MTLFDLIWLAVFFAVCGILSHFIGDALPRDSFNPDGPLYRAKPFEREGRFYEKLGIKRWKDKLPDKSRVVKTETAKTITSMTDMGHTARLIEETCVAEAVHLALMGAAVFLPLLVRGPALWLGLLLAILGNLPFVLIQRYNRPRLVAMFKRQQKRARSRMHVLILSCNTGGGHNSVGRALAEEFESRGIPCTMADTLSVESKSLSKLVSKAHSTIYIRAPRLFGIGYDFVDRHDSKHKAPAIVKAGSLHSVRLKNYIRDNGFNVLIFPHVFSAAAYCSMEEHLSPDIVTGFIATDYTCSPGVANLSATVQLIFIPHGELRREFTDKGVPAEKIVASGIPVSPRFGRHMDRAEARRTLELPLEEQIILIMTGSMGCGAVDELVEQLRSLPAIKLVICGNNRELKEALDKEFAGDPRVITTGFTDRVDLYFDAADLLITKGGGLSSTEAAVKGIPMVHLDTIPGLESRNLAFFSARGMSLIGGNASEAAKNTALLLSDSRRREEMVQAQRRYIPGDAAKQVCDALHRRFYGETD